MASGLTQPQPLSRACSHCAGRMVTFGNPPEFLGAVPGYSLDGAKDMHGQTRELAVPVSGGFAPLYQLKMLQNGDLGVHWGLLVLEVPPGPKGSSFCSLGRA